MKPEEEIKLLRQAAEALLEWHEAEEKNPKNYTFNEKMDLCKLAEWSARKALGQDVGDFEGVPRLMLKFNQLPPDRE